MRNTPGMAAAGRCPFVGRERELVTLTERLEAAGRGEGSVVFVSGEPGIGKSRLLGELADRARRAGWLTLSGRAYDMEGMPPYLPFIEVLRDYVHRASDEALGTLAGEAPAICLLLPEIRSRVSGLPEPPRVGPEGERFRLFEAVSAFLVDIARSNEAKGVVLLLDDLHWADRPTLLLFEHIARKLSGTPLLIVAAYRTTDVDPGHALHAVLADFTRERLGEQILLPPLRERDTSTLAKYLSGASPAPGFASRLHKETGGNPFFAEEVLRHLLERGADLSDQSVVGQGIPDGVRQVLNQRLSRLSHDTNTLLQAAAVVGDVFAFELLSATSALDPAALTLAVEEAERAGMIQEQGDGYAFAHALIRRTLYDGLSVPRRRQFHLRAAEAMESLGATAVDSSVATLAHHWRLSGHPERALGYLLRAGDVAIGVMAWEETIRHWEDALACMEQTGEPPARQARLLEGLGDLDFLCTFEAHPSVERYVRASELYQSASDPVSAARARSRAGRSLAYPTTGFDFVAALDHLRAAEAVLSKQPASLELGELYAALAHAESHSLRSAPDEMLASLHLLRQTAENLESDFLKDLLRVQSHHLQGHYLGLQGHLAEGLKFEELASETAVALKDKIGAINSWTERWPELLGAYSSRDTPANDAGSYQFSRAHTYPFSPAPNGVLLANMTMNCCGLQSLDLNDPVRARTMHERIRDPQGRFLSPFLLSDLILCGDLPAIRQLAEMGSPNPVTVFSSQVALHWFAGHWPEARSAYDAWAQQWRQAGGRFTLMAVNRMLLRLSRVAGDVPSAESVSREMLGISLSSSAVKYEFCSRAEMALLCAETGRASEAEQHLVRCREILADGEDWRGLGGRASLAEAVSAAARGLAPEADAQFERAIDCFQHLSLQWDEAEAFEIWAGACRRFHRSRDRQSFVVGKLTAACSIYERIGVGQPWFDRLDAIKSRLSADVPLSPSPDLPGRLSEREAEVLRLIAIGKTNGEIADELVISPHTVGRHVSNIFNKLDITRRADAAAWAVRNGLAG